MKKVAMTALALFGAALVLGMAACSNASGGGSAAPTNNGTPTTQTTEGGGNGGSGGGEQGGGGSQQQIPAGCVSVPAKNFGGTAITGSEVFIGSRNLSLPAIYACDHEVTQGEYETYCAFGGLSPSSALGKGTNYPAYYVNWCDAIVYCNLKSKADGLTPCYKLGTSADAADVTKWTGVVKHGEGAAAKYCGPSNDNTSWNGITCDWTANGWRLPTEAEWEMLARGGNLTNSNQTTYSGSNTIGDVAWYTTNSGNKSHEVKTNKVENKDSANSLGLYDMSGNVLEWCWDFFNTIADDTPWTGPASASSGSNRVFRGGKWDDNYYSCSVAFRSFGYSPYDRSCFGFRVVHNAQ